MKSRLILLLTNDAQVEYQFREATRCEGAEILVTRTIGEALETTCARLHELELVAIDFQEGCRGMTLVSAIHTCREDLPIIVLTANDKYRTAALAYANGAAACLAKPTTPEEIEILVKSLHRTSPVVFA